MAPLLQSATTPSDGDAIVTVRGDIDTTTAGQLWQYLSYGRFNRCAQRSSASFSDGVM